MLMGQMVPGSSTEQNDQVSPITKKLETDGHLSFQGCFLVTHEVINIVVFGK